MEENKVENKGVTLKEAVDVIRRLRLRGYDVFFKGKGDGTIKIMVNAVEISPNSYKEERERY